MNVHFIAIGGSAMHNLALALHHKGYSVTGSDDEIFEPALSRLSGFGLLPPSTGWFPEKLSAGTDAVILGMHARSDNPELLKAKELGLKIFSYPEYLYEQSKDKIRIVIGGSHGKTSITAMILHVLKYAGIETDFMVGAQLEGFDVMVKLSETARFMVFEGDEYLTSVLDPRPKFHLYMPDIALISGIAWDHVNVFPTFENYRDQFRIFAGLVPPGGKLIYCADDSEVTTVIQSAGSDMKTIPYYTPDYYVKDGVTILKKNYRQVALKIFGRHNMMNLEGARLVCEAMGVSENTFLDAIESFNGASKRLECLAKGSTCNVYKDFAHSPSKLKATINAVKEQFPERRLVAVMELHTYSSLNKNFLSEYKGSMENADLAVVFFSRHALDLKRLPVFSSNDVSKAFVRDDIQVFTEKEELLNFLAKQHWENMNLLLMSSGNFDGMNLPELAAEIIR